ncbi:uncharacterized [Tachysurus ichikawai]
MLWQPSFSSNAAAASEKCWDDGETDKNWPWVQMLLLEVSWHRSLGPRGYAQAPAGAQKPSTIICSSPEALHRYPLHRQARGDGGMKGRAEAAPQMSPAGVQWP